MTKGTGGKRSRGKPGCADHGKNQVRREDAKLQCPMGSSLRRNFASLTLLMDSLILALHCSMKSFRMCANVSILIRPRFSAPTGPKNWDGWSAGRGRFVRVNHV
jgi:hypothetical protein